MSTLYVTRGLPASGKTFKARKWVAESPETRARVNRDDTRTELHDGEFVQRTTDTPGTERAIIAARDAKITALLGLGLDVVVDDTNLPARTVRDLRKLAVAAGADFEVWDLTDVPYAVCASRNAQRVGRARVPDTRMLDMYHRFVRGQKHPLPVPDEPATTTGPALVPYEQPEPGTAPTVVLVDLDGTATLMSDRGPYDWHRVGEDAVNEPVREAVMALNERGHDVVFMSGRDAICRPQTEAWLKQHYPDITQYNRGIGWTLHMRPAGDQRKDSVVKAELFDKWIRGNYRVVCVFDDRSQVVRMWRALGLTVMQVAEGDF